MVDPGALIRSGRAERVSYEYLDIAMGVPPSSLEPVHTAAQHMISTLIAEPQQEIAHSIKLASLDLVVAEQSR